MAETPERDDVFMQKLSEWTKSQEKEFAKFRKDMRQGTERVQRSIQSAVEAGHDDPRRARERPTKKATNAEVNKKSWKIEMGGGQEMMSNFESKWVSFLRSSLAAGDIGMIKQRIAKVMVRSIDERGEQPELEDVFWDAVLEALIACGKGALRYA